MAIFKSYVSLPEGINAPTLPLTSQRGTCQETAFDRRAKFPQIGERSSTPTGDGLHEGMLVYNYWCWVDRYFSYNLLWGNIKYKISE